MKKSSENLLFIGSMSLNAFGNSTMIMAHLGSAPWAAAGQNLSSVLPISIGLCTVLLQILSLTLSYLMGSKFTISTIVKSLVLALLYGLLIDAFVDFHQFLFIPEHIGIRILYTLIGMNCIAMAISIYLQIGPVLLPFDYLLQSFSKLVKSYTLGTMLSLSIPFLISIIFSLANHQLIGLGFGTLLFVLGNGFLISKYNQRIILSRAIVKTTALQNP